MTRIFSACIISFCAVLLSTTALLLTSASLASAAPASSPNPRSLEANERGVKALQEGKAIKAEEEFQKALDIDRGNITAAYNLSGILVVNNKKTAALNLLREYTAKSPNDPGLWARMGDVHFSDEKLNLALEAYTKAFAIDSNYPKLASKMGLAYALSKKFTESEDFYRKAVVQSPKDIELLNNLCGVLIGNGKFDEAITIGKQSAQIKPTSRAFAALGNAYEGKLELKPALSSYKRAIELGDTSKELADKVKALEKHV